MTDTITATVETLTAEVRVLTVGNRQITAGVAAQLDRVPWPDMEPMGRVRLRDGTAYIGRHRTTGVLVVTDGPERPAGEPILNFDEGLSVPLVGACARQGTTGDDSYRFRYEDGRVFLVSRKDTTERPYEECPTWPRDGCRCGYRQLIGGDLFAEVLAEAFAESDRVKRVWLAARELPLLVLASMR